MSTFAYSTFDSGTDISLLNYDPNQGARFVEATGQVGTARVGTTGKCYTGSGRDQSRCPATPPSANYMARVKGRHVNDFSGTNVGELGVYVRGSATNAAKYVFVFQGNGWNLFKFSTGNVYSSLQSRTDMTIPYGETHTAELYVNGTTLKAYLDGVEVASVTDSTISATDYAGIWIKQAEADFWQAGDHTDADVEGGGDTTAPTVSSPSVSTITSTTATGTATTTETGGTAYAIASTSSTPPSTTQIQAGQTAAGAAAPWSGNISVSSTSLSFNMSGLTASTTYYFHVMHKDAANNLSNVATSSSFTTSAGGDTTPPTLNDPPTVSSVAAFTATGNAVTNEGNGTMYAVVTTSATKPSVTQIQAGQNNSGSAAVWSGNQAVTNTSAKTFSITGLSANTTYYFHVQHKDAANNNSTVVTSASFTTSALGTLSYTDALVNINGTPFASASNITYLIHAISGTLVLTKTGQTTNSSGIPASVSDAALAAGTNYRTIFVLSSGAEGMVNLVAT